MGDPLNRNWFDSLVDDDGSGTTGTVWNKSQVNSFMGVIDAALAPLVPNPAPSLQFSADATISRNTPDGADDGVLVLAGGGTWGKNRGGMLTVAGNEHASAGQVYVQMGDVAGSAFIVMDRGGQDALYVRGSDGVVQLPLGQLWFPGTPNPSADPTTLDDYREPTFTPTLLGSGGQSGQVYASRVGASVKVGRAVTCSGEITLSTVGTFSGYILLGGLPFTVGASGGLFVAAYVANLATPIASLSAQFLAGTTTAILRPFMAGGGVGHNVLDQSNLAAGFTLQFGCGYISTT